MNGNIPLKWCHSTVAVYFLPCMSNLKCFMTLPSITHILGGPGLSLHIIHVLGWSLWKILTLLSLIQVFLGRGSLNFSTNTNLSPLSHSVSSFWSFLWILSVVWTYFPFYSLNVSIQLIVNYRPFLCISEWFRQCYTRLFQWIKIIAQLIHCGDNYLDKLIIIELLNMYII